MHRPYPGHVTASSRRRRYGNVTRLPRKRKNQKRKSDCDLTLVLFRAIPLSAGSLASGIAAAIHGLPPPTPKRAVPCRGPGLGTRSLLGGADGSGRRASWSAL
jgi:hypothetical protein